MHRNLVNLALVLGTLFVITACVCPSQRDEGPQPTPDKRETSANKPVADDKSSDKKERKKDEGDFVVELEPLSNERYAEIDRQIRKDKLLERAADGLNRALMLPQDITLRARDCGEKNAFYNPQDSSITVCYELMEHFYNIFRKGGYADEKAYDMMFDATTFVFLHEVGHALIDVYKLPVTANEEDAADRCSSYINLEELGSDGVNAVLAAADAFQIESKLAGGKARNMADEHLLQEQRFYNALCMLYGSSPDKYQMIVEEGYLPKERAVRCPSEYQKTVESWVSLLEPWRID